METEENSTQVRRTARARKVNPKFFGNDTGYESYMQLVGRITASNYTGNKDSESKDPESEDKQNDGKIDNHESELNEASSSLPDKSTSNSNEDGVLNIAVKTVSIKKSKMGGDFQRNSLKLAPSLIIRCRSSTESEMSEDSVLSENGKKRKFNPPEESDFKKLKVNLTDCNADGDLMSKNSVPSPNNTKVASSINSSQLFQRASPLPISNKLDKNQAKILLTSQPQFNLPGKKLKIVSLTLKKNSMPQSQTGAVVLGEGGPVELKIVKKEIYPVSSSSLPPIIGKGTKDKSSKSVPEKSTDDKEAVSGNWFSSDSEDDIPLNKLLVKDVKETVKKKKIVKDKALKSKIKKNKLNKKEGKEMNDQDDLPLKVLIKKSKSFSKGFNDKLKNTVRKKKMKLAALENVKNEKDSHDGAVKPTASKKRKKMTSEMSEQPPVKMKISKLKSEEGTSSNQKAKSLIIKKKKKKLMKEENETSDQPPVKIKKKLMKEENETSDQPPVKMKMKKKLMKEENETSDQPPVKMKISKIKSEVETGTGQNEKSLILKKKKKKLMNEENESKNRLKKFSDKKLKQFMKASKSEFKNREELSFKKKVKEGKSFQKLRFKFPKKLSKTIKGDTPLANETTNVVISVSGIEGDYACVAIPKPEVSEPDSPEPKPKPKKKKIINENSFNKKYTFDSGLVLEDVPIDANVAKKVEVPACIRPKGKLSIDTVKSESGIKKCDSIIESDASSEDAVQKKAFDLKNSGTTQQQKTVQDSKENISLIEEDKLKSIDKKETLIESEVKKNKDRKKDAKSSSEDEMSKSKKGESEHKKHKQNRKESLSTGEDIKSEEKFIKKERSESKESSKKNTKENANEKSEKENKDLIPKILEKGVHSSSKSEREDSRLGSSSKKSSKEEKLDITLTPKKPSKENKADTSLKEMVKIEKETTKEDKEATTPGFKIKKKENFEEALLSIPLPKLLKHKRDKDDKNKKDKEDKHKKFSKDKKFDVKQEIHLIKHREYDNEKENSKTKENSKSPFKLEKSTIKVESHSRDIKKEDRGHHRDERRHSSSSSRSEKRRHEHGSKDVKVFDDSFNEERERKRKREERERRHSSSHKKHKRDHESSHRNHSSSSSSEKKKHKTEHDYKYNKEKASVKLEDKKDIIINKMIDGVENHDIKKDEDMSPISEPNQIASRNSKSESVCQLVKNEMKAEVVIEEEHLVNVGNSSMKEESNEETIVSLVDDLKSEIHPEQKVVPSLLSACKNILNSMKIEPPSNDLLKEDVKIQEDTNNKKINEEANVENVFAGDQKIHVETIEKKFTVEDSHTITNTDLKNYHSAEKESAESDLGILDELRTLKQMSIEERMKSEVKFNKDEIEDRINTSESLVNESIISNSSADKDDEVNTKADLEELFGDYDRSPVAKPEQDTKELFKSEPNDISLTQSNDDCEIQMDVEHKAAESKVEELANCVMLDPDNSLETSTNKNQLDEENKSELLEEEDKQDSTFSDCIVNRASTPDETLKSDLSSSDTAVDEKTGDLVSYATIPLPSEEISDETLIPTPDPVQSPSSPFPVEESTSLAPSEPDEGFSEVSSHTREPISSDEENLSEDEVLQPIPEVIPKELTPEEKEELERKNKQVVEERMKSFELLDENLYLAEKIRNKRSKEAKRMVCDCTLTKEEIGNREMGCGDDCLNKLLMIECGSRCPLKDLCMNKKFQQKDYRKVEVFNAEEKGCGVRSCEEVEQGTFIMEYIGEVFDTKEFKRRRKDYAKSGSPHFYFMALRSDRLIDATRKGNISRFVNHSCSPNAETQKWTVNGDVRVGFFATRTIPPGEEITFDYRLERYGREPQKCYCGTPECRGWLGEPPDKKTKEEKEEDRRKELKDKQKRGTKRYFEDMDLEDEIEKLTLRGLRNRQDTLNLSRLMVRCEDSESRLTLLKILESGEEASKRLFLDYHGLKLLWSWMVDISTSHKCIPLKLEILKTLNSLPITNKTQVTDSKVLTIVERWCKMENKEEKKEEQVEGETKEAVAVQDKKLSDGSDSDTETSETKDSDPSPSDTVSPDDSSQDSNEVVEAIPIVVEVTPIDQEETKTSTPVVVEELNGGATEEAADTTTEEAVTELANTLLSVWSALKEAFKIPKKERIEMMKEHEREVDQEYEKYMDKKSDDFGDDRKSRYYESWRNYSADSRDKRDQRDREWRRDRRRSKWKDYEEDDRGLSKVERRERFAKQVAKEEEEARQRKLQEEMWKLHLDRCSLLGHDPYFTPIFDPSGQYYWDPAAGTWQAYIGPNVNLPVPASYGMNRPEGNENICPNIPTNQMFVSGAFYPLPHIPIGDEECHTIGGSLTNEDNSPVLDLASIPLPGEIPLSKGISPTESPMGSCPPPPGGENDDMDIDNGIETPPMAPPGPVTIKLPQKWKIARDIERRIYFYHTKTRHTQWDLPTDDLHSQLMKSFGLSSDSESDPDTDSDTSSSSDSEDFSSEEENEDEEVESDPVKKIETEFDEKMIRRPKGKKVRSEKLVQERVISPILFRDREAARRERKEAKERAREEARKERYTLIKAIKGGNTKTDLENDKNSLMEDAMSPNENDEDEHLEEQLLKFSRKKSEGKHKGKSKERAATALADTSDLARKIKDSFRSRMATYIVSVLNPYRKGECKEGRITSNEDFKYLARKLTHFVMVKELKQLPGIDGLECSESVKHKTKEFVRKYMSKYGNKFKRDPNDTKEY